MDRYDMAVKLLGWAKEHPREWDIICGFERGSLEQNLNIAETLRDERFYELSLMMTLRVLQLRMEIEGTK